MTASDVAVRGVVVVGLGWLLATEVFGAESDAGLLVTLLLGFVIAEVAYGILRARGRRGGT